MYEAFPISSSPAPLIPQRLTVTVTGHMVKMAAIYGALFLTPIAVAVGLTSSSVTKAPLVSPATQAQTQDYTRVVNVSADSPTQQNNQFAYELSLANGFLNKAISLSNASVSQTVDEKNTIVQLLNQALESANRAVNLDPANPDAYSARGRVYLATSVLNPEMKTLADQDFAKASSLGSSTPTQAPNTKNPVELLPTQQAQNTIGSVIAGSDQHTKETVNGSFQQNAVKGTVTLKTGKTEIFVPYTKIKDTTQLYVTAEDNRDNTTIYVKNKEAGVGFTVAVTSAPSAPLAITWWEIQ